MGDVCVHVCAFVVEHGEPTFVLNDQMNDDRFRQMG